MLLDSPRLNGEGAPSARAASPAVARARRFTQFDAAMLGAVAISVAGDVAAAATSAGWRAAVAIDVVLAGYIAMLAVARRARRPLLGRLFLLGAVSGVVELFTDAAGERVVHSLSYPPGEPMLWASPVYMPLSWALVLTQLGYLAWRLRGLAPRLPLWAACALTGLAGGLLVPFYEELAYHARWWQYAPALRIGHTPLYVVLFEAAVCAALPLVLARVERHSPWRAAGAGLLIGMWMPWAALLSWLLLGRPL